MKKYLTLALGCVFSAMAFGQNSGEPVILKDCTARKITQDGKWVGCYGFSYLIYNVETQESQWYAECSLGNGNSISLDGTGVGTRDDYGVILSNNKITIPEVLRKDINGINAITPDGSRIAGYIMNPKIEEDNPADPFDEGYTIFVPFYCDIDAEGNVGPLNYIPYPEKDFLDYAPMYVTGVWISDDGKTILGEMTDSFGRFQDPVVFHENENGEWTFLTPTKEFNNPDGIELPPNPWISYPSEPKIQDFMYPDSYEAYMESWQEYFAGLAEEPDPFEYMSEEQIQAYFDAVEEYENYFYDHKAEIDAYESAYRKILQTSLYFGESAMDIKGEKFVTSARSYDSEGTGAASMVFVFDTLTGEYKQINSKVSDLKIQQVLSDGTIIAYTGLFTYDVLHSYILLPGEDEFISMREYVAQANPAYSAWLDAEFPKGEGIVAVSDDMSVIAGGLDILHVADMDSYGDTTLLSYILPDMKSYTSVETIDLKPADGTYTVFNLQGIKVLETKDKSEINRLSKGIYIINGKKFTLK